MAISFGAAASFSFTARTAAASFSAGSSPRDAALELGALFRIERRETRSCQASRAGRPRSPAARHCSRMAAGISKAGALQPSFCRAAAISSAPSGEPWLFAVPALVGAPKPMMVRQAISDGRSDFFAASMRRGDRRRIVAVDALCRPAGGLEALHLIDGIGERKRAVDRDAVVVEQHDELVQLQVPGKRDRLLADAFHQVAVGGEHVGVVIDDVAAEERRQVAFGDRHADRIGEPLAERPGGGLDAGRVAVFGMAGRERAELAEALDLVDRHLLVAGEIEQRVEQHRAVAGGEHEAVAVGPGRIGRVEFQEVREQHGGDVGRAHRQAGMAGLRLLDRIHGERADGVRHAVVFARARTGSRGRQRENVKPGRGLRSPREDGPASS